jgi:hypothetical protein
VSDFLKGNFDVKRPPTAPEVEQDLTDRFEHEALKRLGGSIAFVSKKKFLYGATPVTEEAKRPTLEHAADSTKLSSTDLSTAADTEQKPK